MSMTKKKWAKKVVFKAARKAADKAAKKAVRKLAKKPARQRDRLEDSLGIGRVTFDSQTGYYVSTCRVEGHELEVYLDASENPGDVEELKRFADATIRAWPTLRRELCELARKEIIASKGLSEEKVPQLAPEEATPFSLTVAAQRDAEPYWSFGLSVSADWLDEEEYLDISRSVDGDWTTVEVRSSE